MTYEEAYRIAVAYAHYVDRREHGDYSLRIAKACVGPDVKRGSAEFTELIDRFRSALFEHTKGFRGRDILERIVLLVPILQTYDYIIVATRLSRDEVFAALLLRRLPEEVTTT